MSSPYRILVVGNPNCGKSSLFNKLTGLNQKTGNFAGVTVEKHSGYIKSNNLELELIDLPGAFSLNGSSDEKKIVTKFLMQRQTTDKLLFVMDATLIERSLQFFFQIVDLGIPVLLVLTMKDILEKRNIPLSIKKLEQELNVKCYLVNAKTGEGVSKLKADLFKAENFKTTERKWKWDPKREEFLKEIVYSIDSENPRLVEFLVLNTFKKLSGEVLQEELPDVSILSFEINNFVKKKFLSNGLKYTYSEELIYKSFTVKNILSKCLEREYIPNESKLVKKLDTWLMHPKIGLGIFLLIMGLVFQALFSWAEIPMNFIEAMFQNLGELISKNLPEGPLSGLVSEGIIGGVGSVMVFIPQISLLFFFLGLLEESGYMARASFVMDKFMGKFGLSGKSFIPILSSAACAVPSILGTRSIEDKSDRIRTILVSPLITCSARYPVYILVIGTVFPEKTFFGFISLRSLILFGLFFLGMFTAFCFALLFKKTFFQNESSYFILEIPNYQIPSLKNVAYNVYKKVKDFVVNSGQIILFASILLWFLANYPYRDMGEEWKGKETEFKEHVIKNSYAALIGQTIEPVIEPLGFDWKIGISLITSFAAREVMVSTLAIIYGVESEDSSVNLSQAMLSDINPKTGKPVWNLLTGISVLIFFAYACQCMSTLAVVRKETNSYFWPIFLFIYMGILAYLSSLAVFQIGSLFL